MNILIVDDDASFRELAEMALKRSGMRVRTAADAEQARLVIEDAFTPFDVMLFDVDMPGSTGLELLRELREGGDQTPALFVSGMASPQDKIAGLRIGADDYLAKPVAFEELVARIEAVSRRSLNPRPASYGGIRLDAARRRATIGDREVELSPRESDLLWMLIRAEGQPVAREDLLREVMSLDFDPQTNVLDVHIGRLRKKLGPHGRGAIETVRGIGYRLLSVSGD